MTHVIGELSEDKSPEVEEVETETGIRAPTWFKVGGTTLSQVNAAAQRVRR